MSCLNFTPRSVVAAMDPWSQAPLTRPSTPRRPPLRGVENRVVTRPARRRPQGGDDVGPHPVQARGRPRRPTRGHFGRPTRTPQSGHPNRRTRRRVAIRRRVAPSSDQPTDLRHTSPRTAPPAADENDPRDHATTGLPRPTRYYLPLPRYDLARPGYDLARPGYDLAATVSRRTSGRAGAGGVAGRGGSGGRPRGTSGRMVDPRPRPRRPARGPTPAEPRPRPYTRRAPSADPRTRRARPRCTPETGPATRVRRSRRRPEARSTSRAGGTSAPSPSTCARASRSRRG